MVFLSLYKSRKRREKNEGKRHILWGIIGITIMLGVWTIMNMLLNTLGINYIHPQAGTVDTLPAAKTTQ